MKQQLHKRSILSKTFQFAFWTFISRILGALREALQIRLMGISGLSDAFIMAFRIPSSFRKVFAEGAASAAFVPFFIKISKEGNKKRTSRLMSAALLFFEGIVLLCCLFVWCFPHLVIKIVASGFNDERMSYAVHYVRILFPFIFFISSSSLLSGALQAENHFFMTAFGPVLLNIFFIGALLACLYYNFSITFLCYGIVVGGVAQLLLYFMMYRWYGYSIERPTLESWKLLKTIIKKFCNCLFGVSIMELNLIIDGTIASQLAPGSPSILHYGSRFMQIPLGVFAVAFSTVMLSYCSRVLLYAPRRLNFLVFEGTKFIVWVITPAMLFLMFSSHRLFSTILMTKNVTSYHIWQSQWVLIIFSFGLLFFSLNKLLTTVFYSFGDTWTPTKIGIIATFSNAIGNLLSWKYGMNYAIFGIAASTVLSGVVSTIFSFYYLMRNNSLRFPLSTFLSYVIRYSIQVTCIATLFCATHALFFYYICTTSWFPFFYAQWGYWLFALPLAAFCAVMLIRTRSFFRIQLYFL